jgi:hypothetical protein
MLHGTRPWVILAVIAMLTLLLGFDRVVRQGVQQGANRRAAELDRSSALWRCNLLQGQPARTECRMALR